jgi:uncharacterized protein YjbI with pentapeptide repeats
MTENKGFPTKEEAVEAWNTWRGRYVAIPPEVFQETNPCNDCGLVVKDGYYNPLPVDEMVGGRKMTLDGSFTVPWPRLGPGQAKLAEKHFQNDTAIEYAFSLRARWCALFPSVIEYRDTIAKLLKENDRDNKVLNGQLNKWNEYLSSHGFTAFEKNDLRGINLGGLELNDVDYAGIYLRNIDLSFSELSVAQLQGANCYGALFLGANLYQTDLSYSICAKANFSYACLSSAKFKGSDLNSANLTKATCYKTFFDGAILNNAVIIDASLAEASLDILQEEHDGKMIKRKTEIVNIIFNENTEFKGISVSDVDWTKNPKLRSIIENQNVLFCGDKTLPWWKRLLSAIDAKPGWLGFSIDLKKIFQKKGRS